MTEYQDKEIECVDCHSTFIFEAGEQEFFSRHQYTEPKRCVTCRKKKKNQGLSSERKNNNGRGPSFERSEDTGGY